jgi:outer membrane lipoprotein carrier protein
VRRQSGIGILALALVAALAASASAEELEQVVAGVEATYGKVNDLRADFAQIATNKSLGQDIKAEGTVYLKKGGKMRWDYKSPSPQQIVSDGTSLWVYTPELNQVNKGNAPKALAGPAGSFLAGLGRVRDEFSVRFLNPANKVDSAGRFVLDLTPKAPTPLLTRLVLAVDPKDYIVRQAVLYDQLQNTVTMNFTKVAANAALPDSLFTFTPPAGAAVVPLEMR